MGAFQAMILMTIGIHFLLILAFVLTSPPPKRHSRYDTPEKAIARARERYVNGEMTLDEYEEKVYQIIPVEDPP